jgi:hypothetical protein
MNEMVTVRVKGYLREDGKIEVELPDNWQPGEIEFEVEVAPAEVKDETIVFQPVPADQLKTGGWEDLDMSDDPDWPEISPDEMLSFEGLTNGELLESGLVGTGATWDIGDSAEWVEQRRQSRRRKNRW